MTGHGEKFTRKMEGAIAALLAEPTVELAAARTGVSVVTLQRWQQRPDFRRRFREARRAVVEGAIAGLQRATAGAVEALERNLHCAVPSVEVRAALGILETAIRGVELVDLVERVEALEEQQKGDGNEDHGKTYRAA